VGGVWRGLHNEELHNVRFTRVIKWRRMRWAGHVALMVEMRNVYNIFVGKLVGKDHSEDLGMHGSTILEWILRKKCGNV
jgi:hypothetical protein